jgi:hypothetical protein
MVDYSDTLARVHILLVGQEGADATSERLHQHPHIGDGCHPDDAAQRFAEQVSQHQVGLAGTNVYGDNRSPPRLDIEKRRFAPANRLTRGALEHQLLREELVDNDAYGTATDAHGAGEVGPGNRLMRADEIQGDAAVDVPRRALRRYPKAAGVDSAHIVITCDE